MGLTGPGFVRNPRFPLPRPRLSSPPPAVKTAPERSTDPILLSPPHLGEAELPRLLAALASNWIAPTGPDVDGFEREFAQSVGASDAVALHSGTAALHLALILSEVGPGDIVLASTFTFAASAFPIRYQGATPHFLDSERRSWNLDPNALEDALASYARRGVRPKALVAVHLYGQCADLDAISALCERYGVPLIEDAAEALGATYRGASAGTRGRFGFFSFNGNKILTTSGGGMLISADGVALTRARKLAAQAREVAPHYQHEDIGFNYRMSNLLAAIGRGQLPQLENRVEARRRVFEHYRETLGNLPGIQFMPEVDWGRHTRWLTTLTVDPEAFGADRQELMEALQAQDIESRPVWKPMHQQPVFAHAPRTGGAVSDEIFRTGLCLPSGSALTPSQLNRVSEAVRELCPEEPVRSAPEVDL